MTRLASTFVFAALAFMSSAADCAAAPSPRSFAGVWTVEQIPPSGSPRSEGTLIVTENDGVLAGVLRLGGAEVPLSNVSEDGTIISFRASAPDRPGLMLTYSGLIQGNQFGVSSQDLGSGPYTLTAQRSRARPPEQVAQTAPPVPSAAGSTPALSAPVTPAAPSVAAAPSSPAPQAPPSAPPSTLGLTGSAGQGGYVARLLGQVSPSTGQPLAPPPPAVEPPSAVIASASPPAPSSATPSTAPPAPPEPPPVEGPSLEGDWSAERTVPDSTGPSAATLSFAREGDRITGILRTGGQEFPLFDVKQAGSDVSFTQVIPGTPYETINYSGTLNENQLTVAGLGETRGAYGLTAMRQGPTGEASVAPASSAPQEPPETVSEPQVALVTPPAPPPETAVPPPPAPSPPRAPAGDAASAPGLRGDWIAELKAVDSSASIEATLAFDGDMSRMRIGNENLPLYEVTQSGNDVSFTVVVPGTPYASVRYSGVIDGNMMQLSSLDESRGTSTLQAHRAEVGASEPAAPPPPQLASLAPPPVARTPSVAQSATPSPSSARPLSETEAAPSAPPVKLPLPALRDLPPNGLAQTPLMGWASRQKLGSRTDDAAIRQGVEGLVEPGLNLLGYIYVEVGDGWQGVRDAQGVLHPNERFPDMKALGDYIHSQGLKFGLTASAAPKSCNGLEGSYGHEAQDARTFAEWGVDYLAYEWCGAEQIYPAQEEMRAAFQKMGEALRASGRDIVYGISQRGQFGVEQWAARAGANVWRTGNDLGESWASVAAAGFGQNGKEGAAKPGAWNDPGLLQAGNGGMSADESRMQLNLWAVLAAPLMLGNDVRIMTRETVALLGNRELIAVSQDKLGRQGKRVAQSGDTEVWARPLADGSLAVALFNKGTRAATVRVTWEQLGIKGPQLVRDLWWHEDIGTANGNYVVVLSGHTSMLLKLSR
jgi:alpha-galactosidase